MMCRAATRSGALDEVSATTTSVAAPSFQAPGVVVSYTSDPDVQNSKKFLAAGLQTAAGVPLQCDEGADFKTFRIGLFGLDKWHDVAGTLSHLQDALKTVSPKIYSRRFPPGKGARQRAPFFLCAARQAEEGDPAFFCFFREFPCKR